MDLSSRTLITVAAFLLPISALADLSQTATLSTPNLADLNLDTGAITSSGGDIQLSSAGITPQGNATAVTGVGGFEAVTQILLTVFPGYSKALIPLSSLKVGDTFGVHTNGSHYSKVQVTATGQGSITLKFTTFGAAAGASTGPPTITSILNNSSHVAAGLPNYGIAPSSLFAVVGTGLADPGVPVLQSSQAPGIQQTLNGASITAIVNGVTTHPALYYTSPTQLAAVLPAATPVGTGTLTVTYKGVTSAPATLKVVPTALGINTYNTNTGVATDALTGAVLTYGNSGSPGEAIVLWTTGLGADPADSDTTFATTPHSVNTSLQIFIGNVPATILYQGSSGYPGVNQINLVIPDSSPAGCWVSLAAVAGGLVSNIVTLPIAKGGGACVDALTGLNADQISPSGGKTLRTGLVALIQTNTPAKDGSRTITNSTDAAFEKYTGIYTPTNSVSPGGCIVNDLTPVPIGNITGLDIGKITLTGSTGFSVTLASQFGIKGAFFANLAPGDIPSSGGTFTFAATGGADVGPFTATVNLSNPLLTWTNSSAAANVDRSQGLHVTWTGGNPGTYVFITGTSSVTTTTGTATSIVIAGYTCLASVDDGQFTVPSHILSALPAGRGGTEIQNAIYTPLSVSGIDIGLTAGDITYNVVSQYK